ncbi:MAG TPA: Pvc16 family protein [Chloroflexota bacterium]|nr:Pvc16 family protein [Chloroflexota bacterium]
MFTNLDQTLQRLLVRSVPLDPAEIDISFDTPDRDWSGRLSRPTVNLFLFRVQENRLLRPTGWDVRHNGQTRSAERMKPPLRFDATYHVTTWARSWEDQHRLLWRVLVALARHPVLPTDVLVGELKDQPLPISALVAQPEHQPINVSDLWSALDNRVRPALTYVITLALAQQQVFTSPLVLHAPRIALAQLDRAGVEDGFAIRGRVRDREDATRAMSGAVVLLADTGQRATTDAEGRFQFDGAPRGRATFVVRAADRSETIWPAAIPSASYDLTV